MQLFFAGVGEAFDPTQPNCSVTVVHARGAFLLDCGFTAAAALWRSGPPALSPLDLDGVYVSHLHGDHFFGLPSLLLRFWEEGRTKDFTVAGKPGTRDTVMAAMELAYPTLAERFAYRVLESPLTQGEPAGVCGLTLTAAQSDHPQPNWSVRVDDGARAVFYSGDGRPTAETRALAQNADLVIHESFSLEEDTPGHGTAPGSIAFARAAGAKRLALVHLRHDVRRDRKAEILSLMEAAEGLDVLLPESGQWAAI